MALNAAMSKALGGLIRVENNALDAAFNPWVAYMFLILAAVSLMCKAMLDE